MKFKQLFFISLLLLPAVTNAQKKEIVAYFPEWRAKGEHPYFVKDIEIRNSAEKITVLNYAFLIPKPDTNGNIIPAFIDSNTAYQQVYSSAMSIDGIADDTTQPLRGQFNQLRKLKQRHPELKILLSIGGWEGSDYFTDAALTQESREYFVNTCIDRFIRGNLPEFNGAGGKGTATGIFDGFDIDWEYPVKGGVDRMHHNPDDNNNLSRLLALFRLKLDSINPGFLLTAAVPADEKNARYYNIYNDQQYLDWYNLMTYDYRSGGDTITGHNSNLLSSTVDSTFDRERNSFDKSIRLFTCIYGVSRSKLIPGAAFYGRGWGDVDSLSKGLGMPGNASKAIPGTGYKNFSDLKKLVNQGYELQWDRHSMAPYLYNSKDKIFWTFDDAKSIALKKHYVDSYKLRGLMFWEITGDDSLGTLVNTIYTGNMPDVEIHRDTKNNSSPEIKVIKPAPADWINEGSNIIIETQTSEKNGKIVKVEFFGDKKLLGYNTREPFDWVWFNIPEGKHKVSAVAYNEYGKTKESIPVEITVEKR